MATIVDLTDNRPSVFSQLNSGLDGFMDNYRKQKEKEMEKQRQTLLDNYLFGGQNSTDNAEGKVPDQNNGLLQLLNAAVQSGADPETGLKIHTQLQKTKQDANFNDDLANIVQQQRAQNTQAKPLAMGKLQVPINRSANIKVQNTKALPKEKAQTKDEYKLNNNVNSKDPEGEGYGEDQLGYDVKILRYQGKKDEEIKNMIVKQLGWTSEETQDYLDGIQ